MERGDNGPGRDAYGPPGHERDRRDYRPEGPPAYLPEDGYPVRTDQAARPGGPLEVQEDDYGQLLRRPGEMPPQPQRYRQPARPYPGQPARPYPGQPGSPYPGQPAPFPPGAGPPPPVPVRGARPGNGVAGGAGPAGGGTLHDAPVNGRPVPDGGGQMPRQPYRQPDGRRVRPAGERPYRPPRAGVPGGTPDRHYGPGEGAGEPRGRGRTAAPPGVPGGSPGTARPGGPVPGRPAPGGPGTQAYGGSPGVSGIPPLRERPGAAPRPGAAGRRERPGPEPGPVIRQREAAVPEDPGTGPAQPVASIEPDGLEAFARDLRALRAQADLDYPEMADVSHYEMKSLAAAAAGLRLPTLPVTVAFVRACGGNVTEWEERWQKLAAKITADAVKKRGNNGDEQASLPEPADGPATPEPAAPKAAAPAPGAEPAEVYVITSARPRQPGW
ncbi:MAG: hypothetical protein JO037_26880 [Actinobacteria bacterium]|nr:hypothetical protein [Actinomycetota bacterium]